MILLLRKLNKTPTTNIGGNVAFIQPSWASNMKDTIRKQIKEKIKNIPSNKKQGYSFCITQKIIEKFGHLENRHIYISMPDEVDTTMLISHLQQIGKKTFSCNTPDTELPTIDIIIVP
ncbi:hypothetical protein KKG31_00830 [Patescibacteria group bacterium]|nr:hypothetical protein [Patescibacteria group bacterium]MBU1757727.1 hypothetical protein [Patescibacteria group bacterium]